MKKLPHFLTLSPSFSHSPPIFSPPHSHSSPHSLTLPSHPLVLPSLLPGSRTNIFCDKYDSSQQTYCKRLRVLCPEHTKEPKVQYSVVEYSVVQFSMAQSTVRTVQYSIVHYADSVVQFSMAQSTVQYSTV